MEDTDEPYTMRLAKEGVESKVAYEAAAEAERQRLKAERERMESKSVGQTIIEETDITRLLETAAKLFAAGQQSERRRQQQQPAAVKEQRETASRRQNESPEKVSSPLRETIGEEIDNADES